MQTVLLVFCASYPKIPDTIDHLSSLYAPQLISLRFAFLKSKLLFRFGKSQDISSFYLRDLILFRLDLLQHPEYIGRLLVFLHAYIG